MKFNKISIILIALAAIAVYFVWQSTLPKQAAYKTVSVTRGTIRQEIAETGTIKKGDPINLSFKNAGTISSIQVTVGQNVVAGQILATLDANQLNLKLQQARADLSFNQIKLDKLQNGADAEDVKLAQNAVNTVQDSLASSQQSLKDAQNNASSKIDSAYQSAQDALNSAYSKAYNAQNFASLFQRTNFPTRNDDGIYVWEIAQKMTYLAEQIKKSIPAESTLNYQNLIDQSLTITQQHLASIQNYLREMRAISEKTNWREVVSQTDKNTLDTHIDYINTSQTSINTGAQTIALQKSANETAVNTAKAAVTAAAGALKTAHNQYDKITATPRPEDIDLLKIQLEQSQAQIKLLELQISDSQLIAPADGQIIEINSRIGESSQIASSKGAVVMLPADPYIIEVDIYEEDVVKEKIGDPVKISLAALGDQTYEGKVISIDPSGRSINGVIYYTTKIGFQKTPQNIRPEMTADITITTDTVNSALLIPESSIQKKDSLYFVQTLENGVVNEIPVQVGIKSKGIVQAISKQLTEGQLLIIP